MASSSNRPALPASIKREVRGSVYVGHGLYECPECGRRVRSNHLHIHHIMLYCQHPEMHQQPENLTALCATCHRRWHQENPWCEQL